MPWKVIKMCPSNLHNNVFSWSLPHPIHRLHADIYMKTIFVFVYIRMHAQNCYHLCYIMGYIYILYNK